MTTPFRAGRPPGFRPQAAGLPAFTGSYTLLADCSEFQPDITDAAYLKWSPAIVIRACYGDAHDDKAWYGGARRDALHAGGARFVGIYQYLVASQPAAAQAQALHGLAGALRPGEVLIADFEEGAKPLLTGWYNEMLALYGHQVNPYLWTYTGESFGQSAGVLPVEWVAAYGTAEPATPHKLWQFTDSYQVPGAGVCDCSVFRGSIGQLAALAYGGQPATLTPAPDGLRQSVKATAYTVTFAWDPVAGHDSYHWQLEWWKPGFGWVLSWNAQVTGTSRVISLPPTTRYRWRVAAGDADYIWSPWTEVTTP